MIDPILQAIQFLREDLQVMRKEFREDIQALQKEQWIQAGKRIVITAIISGVVSLITTVAVAFFGRG